MGLLGKALSKLVYRRTVGLYVGDEEITLSELAWSLAGPVECAKQVEPFDNDSLAAVLERMLNPWKGRKGRFRASVSIGLSPFRVFFSSRPVKSGDKELKPSILLHELLQSSNVNVDDMEVETMRSQTGKQPLITLVACRRRYLLNLIQPLLRMGIRPYRVEPSPFALLRLAAKKCPAPRKSTTVMRVFVGKTQGVALVVNGQVPLAWRTFDIHAANEAVSIRAGIMALQMVVRFRSEVPKPDLIMVHGRDDLSEDLNSPDFLESMGLKARVFPKPSLDAENFAKGLAYGIVQPEDEGYDLSRALKPKRSVWEMLPRVDIAMQFFMLNMFSLLLADVRNDVRHKLVQVKTEIEKHEWMQKTSEAKLEAEKKETAKKIEAVQSFLDTRILWSSLVQNTTDKLPGSVTVKSITAQCEMENGSKKAGGRSKKSLVLRMSSPIPEGQVMPREVEDYITTLRTDKLLSKDFPNIEVGDLKWMSTSGKNPVSNADFVVTCLPKVEKAAPKPKAEPKEGH